jgi:hypothetical protein
MFGILGTRYIETLPNIDAAYINGLQTRSGLELSNLFPRFDAAMGAINLGVDPLVAMLTFPTTSAVGKRRRVTRKVVQMGGEFTIPRSQVGRSAGHMLPIWKVEEAIGATEDGLHEMSLDAIDEELQDIVRSFGMYYRGVVLERLFSAAQVPVGRRTNVTSPGLAGSGTGDNVFSGIYPSGAALPGGYSHYYFTNAAGLMATIIAMRDRIKKWHRGPYDLLASPAALTAIRALSSITTYGADAFAPVSSALLNLALGERSANVDAGSYVGVIAGNVRVMESVEELGSTSHFSIFKSYGDFNPDNPLAWRYDPSWGRDVFTRTRDAFPLADAVALQWLGIGVSDRTAATVALVDEAAIAYAAPTVTF